MMIDELLSLYVQPKVSFRDLRSNVYFLLYKKGKNTFSVKVIENKDNVKYQKTITKKKMLEHINNNDIIVVINVKKVRK
jgi:hypothetical protein